MNTMLPNRKCTTRALGFATVALYFSIWGSQANAQHGTWTGGGSDGNWSNAANWNAIAGGTSGILNTGTAFFNSTSSNNVVTVDSYRVIRSMHFSTASGGYTFNAAGGNSLHVASGGILQVATLPDPTNNPVIFNVPIVLEPTSATGAGAHTFRVDGANVTMTFNGNISGGTTTGAITLNLSSGSSANARINGSISDGGAAGGVAVVKANNATWVLSGSNSYSGGTTISSGRLEITNAHALGTGALTFSAASNLYYSGNEAIALSDRALNFSSAGTINLVSNGDLDFGKGSITLNANTTLRTQGTVGSFTFGGNLSDGGAGYNLTKVTDAGHLIFTGNLSHKGYVMVDGGTVTLSGSNTYAGGTILDRTSTASTYLNINSNHALGSGTLTIKGNTTATLDNTSGHAVTLATNNAQEWFQNITFTGSDDLNLGTGNVTVSANRTVTTNGSTLTVGGNISGAGFTLTKSGSGTLVLGGLNTTGNVTVNGGVLRLASTGAISGGIGASGGTAGLTLGGASAASTGVIELTAASGNFYRDLGTGANAVQFAAGGGGFSAYDVDRVVNLGGAGAELTWGNAASGWHASATTLYLSSSQAKATIDFQNALNLNSNAARTFSVANGTADIDAEVSGSIRNTGTGGVVKTGAGTLLMSGSNSYNGGTAISAGAIHLGHEDALGGAFAGVTTVAAGAELRVLGGVSGFGSMVSLNGGTFVYNGAGAYNLSGLEFNSGTLSGTGDFSGYLEMDSVSKVLRPGDGAPNSVGIMNFQSDPTWSAFTYDWGISSFQGTESGTDFSQINIDGGLYLDAAGTYVLKLSSFGLNNTLADFSEVGRSWNILTAVYGIEDFNLANWSLDLSGFNVPGGWLGNWSLSLSGNQQNLVLNYTVVPEPSAFALAGAGALLFAGARRAARRK